MFYKGKTVLVTGGTGMVGSHLAELLLAEGAAVRISEFHTRAKDVFDKKTLKDLRIVKADLTTAAGCRKAVKGADAVFQLAACLTGILGNHATPVRMFTPNVLIQTNMLEAAYQAGVARYLVTSSACIYASEFPVPLREEVGLLGQPDPNNEAHAWAKRLGELQAKYYAKEYGMKIGIARPFNSYGPRDNFDPQSSHVIAGLIRRVLEKGTELRLWGSGETTRDFVYVADTARAMRDILEKHPQADPINIAGGGEITMKELAALIMRLAGVKKRLVFDAAKPRGQERRVGCTEKAERLLGFKPAISLEEGLKRTIDWYRSHQKTVKQYAL